MIRGSVEGILAPTQKMRRRATGWVRGAGDRVRALAAPAHLVLTRVAPLPRTGGAWTFSLALAGPEGGARSGPVPKRQEGIGPPPDPASARYQHPPLQTLISLAVITYLKLS